MRFFYFLTYVQKITSIFQIKVVEFLLLTKNKGSTFWLNSLISICLFSQDHAQGAWYVV
jgi:hypothetical protein